MQKRSKQVERLRRFARRRPGWAFRHSAPRFSSICQVEITSALDVHMTNWDNCGGARSHGVLFGRALSVTAWDICMTSMGARSMLL